MEFAVGTGSQLICDFGEAVYVVSGIADGIRMLCQLFPSAVQSGIGDYF